MGKAKKETEVQAAEAIADAISNADLEGIARSIDGLTREISAEHGVSHGLAQIADGLKAIAAAIENYEGGSGE